MYYNHVQCVMHRVCCWRSEKYFQFKKIHRFLTNILKFVGGPRLELTQPYTHTQNSSNPQATRHFPTIRKTPALHRPLPNPSRIDRPTAAATKCCRGHLYINFVNALTLTPLGAQCFPSLSLFTLARILFLRGGFFVS